MSFKNYLVRRFDAFVLTSLRGKWPPHLLFKQRSGH
jgi:hypothetical protein